MTPVDLLLWSLALGGTVVIVGAAVAIALAFIRSVPKRGAK